MTKYREIIRLTSLGCSQRTIVASCGVAQKTVVKVQKRANELNLMWPLKDDLTDRELAKMLFPKLMPFSNLNSCLYLVLALALTTALALATRCSFIISAHFGRQYAHNR